MVRFPTTEAIALTNAHGGELLGIIEDGRRRKRKHTDPSKVNAWLMRHHHEVADSEWMDPAGYVHPRRQGYRSTT